MTAPTPRPGSGWPRHSRGGPREQAREAEIAAALSALDGTLQAPDVEAVQAAFAWVVDLAPAHPQLDSLRRRIAEHQERVQEDRSSSLREALADAGRLIREGQVQPALDALARVRAAQPDHPDLSKLERQAQRLVAGREEKVRALVTTARDLLERDDVQGGQRALQEALALDPKHADALAILQSTQARGQELAAVARADALAAEATRLLGEGKLAEGEARARELRELAPQHQALADLPALIEQAKRTQDPEVIVQTALDEVARLLREVRPERVADALGRIRAVQPNHPQLAKLEAQAQKLLEARDARLKVRNLVDRARKLQVRGEFEEALTLAEEAVTLAPDDGSASRLRDDLADQLQDAKRQGRPTRSASPAPAARRQHRPPPPVQPSATGSARCSRRPATGWAAMTCRPPRRRSSRRSAWRRTIRTRRECSSASRPGSETSSWAGSARPSMPGSDRRPGRADPAQRGDAAASGAGRAPHAGLGGEGAGDPGCRGGGREVPARGRGGPALRGAGAAPRRGPGPRQPGEARRPGSARHRGARYGQQGAGAPRPGPEARRRG